MSTKYTEEIEIKETVSCKICNGNFVPGGTRFNLPKRVCLWCFCRGDGGFKGPGAVVRRMFMLYDALSSIAATHPDACDCYGCQVFRKARTVFDD